ncbi:hypothetical protein [Kangiella sp. TOML190]|uniref:hypothetical protein n=1 Tax=Kangiella sp. TOML190 TaxID=2931351 RepID=UPI00203E3E4E|nr:hypothetical protein [Kangiella sp. TOML190]
MSDKQDKWLSEVEKQYRSESMTDAQVSPEVRQRLASMRQEVLDTAEANQSISDWRKLAIPSALAATFVMVFIGVNWNKMSTDTSLAFNPEEIPIIMATDEIEFYQELEFYEWLEQETH